MRKDEFQCVSRGLSLALWGGLIGPLIFSITTIIAAYKMPGHSHFSNFISELAGATSPVRSGMILFGFIPGGICIAAFGKAVAKRLGSCGSKYDGPLMIQVFGAGMIVAGIFPCDVGAPPIPLTWTGFIHNITSFAIFVAISFAPLLCYSRFVTLGPSWSNFSRSARILSFCMFLFLALTIISGFFKVARGFFETIFVAQAFLWMAFLSVKLGRMNHQTKNT